MDEPSAASAHRLLFAPLCAALKVRAVNQLAIMRVLSKMYMRQPSSGTNTYRFLFGTILSMMVNEDVSLLRAPDWHVVRYRCACMLP
jgi:hypothetical protein